MILKLLYKVMILKFPKESELDADESDLMKIREEKKKQPTQIRK